MKEAVCISIDSELIKKARDLALKTHRSFSGVVEMSLQKFLVGDKNDKRE